MELVEKEHNFIQARMRANIWAYTYSSLKHQFEEVSGSTLKAGIKVRFNVSINFHEVYGISLIVNNIDSAYTAGERSRLRAETIKRLREEGLIDLNKQLELPLVPQRIAIISAETAAGYGDFINQLAQNARGYGFSTTLFNALMQGNEAVDSIRKAFKTIQQNRKNFDAVILIRGGGAQTDLDSFDSYDLGKTISAFPIPVLTGIGHERDQTVADLTAHTSLKTPTAVAGFLISGMERFDDLLEKQMYRIAQTFDTKINEQEHELIQYTYALESLTKGVLAQETQFLKEKSMTLKYLSNRLTERQQSQLDTLEKQIRLIDPQTIFKRGYSVTLKNGKSINQQQLMIGDQLETRTYDQKIKSRITAINTD